MFGATILVPILVNEAGEEILSPAVALLLFGYWYINLCFMYSKENRLFILVVHLLYNTYDHCRRKSGVASVMTGIGSD